MAPSPHLTRLLQLDLALALPTRKEDSREPRTPLVLKVPKAPLDLMARLALPATSLAARPVVSWLLVSAN